MSHSYLLELYESIGDRKREMMARRSDETLSALTRREAQGADVFLDEAMAFFSSNYHGKLPKRLRIKHPPEGYLPV